MPTEAQLREGAELIWKHWQAGSSLAELPAHLRPTTRAEAYGLQAHYERRSASAPYGWKIAATSKVGQSHIGVDGPIGGRILAEWVAADGGTLSLATNRMRLAEPEFAFKLASRLAPRPAPYTVDEVLAVVASLHPALEIPSTRFTDVTKVGAAQIIADNACAHDFVLGPAAPPSWRSLDLSQHAVAASISSKLERAGAGANVLGDPRKALCWLVNELSAVGVALEAGQVVTTGTCMEPVPVAPGDHLVADFGVLGRVSVRFTA